MAPPDLRDADPTAAWTRLAGSGLRGAVAPALGLDPRAGAALAEALLALEPRAALRRLPDRQTFLVDPGAPGELPRCLDVDGDPVGLDPRPGGRPPWVVKCHRGGRGRQAVGEALRELVAGSAPRSPGRREAETLAALAALGLPVPAPLLWARRGPVSLTVLAFVPHPRTLRGAVEAGELSAARLDELAALVARLHAAGWYHRDLYLDHLLETGDGLVLIDAGRARRDPLPRLRWLAKDLAALSSSAPPDLVRARLRVLVRWRRALARAGRPVDPRALLPELARREARMRGRTPRHAHRPLEPPGGEG